MEAWAVGPGDPETREATLPAAGDNAGYREGDTGVTMKTAPWHSATGDSYHSEAACIHGRRVKKENRRCGDGGKRHCGHCKWLEQRRWMREMRER